MSNEENNEFDMFTEPEGFYPPEKPPTLDTHTMLSGDVLTLRLVGHSPLWGHLLFHAGHAIAHYVEERADTIVAGKNVLELGAGAGAPSITCALGGANQVVASDFPDPDLLENLRMNIDHCSLLTSTRNIHVEGYVWGNVPLNLLSHLNMPPMQAGFDLVLLSDLVFNHSEHMNLLKSVQKTLRRIPDARALAFFTPHRTWLFEKDMEFFKVASLNGFEVQKVYEKVGEHVMFEDDKGDETLRKTVFGYELRWKELCCEGRRYSSKE
ncbi:MAG: nicotinamide n-methyltransferase [Bogoriella megaspora]|nr:MAG: nicotinamide n-methyltransferase [Bogoriella megaspora]